MPKKSRVPVEEAVDAIVKYIDHFRTNDFPAWSSDTWKEMSKEVDEKWTADCFRLNVHEDRRSILTLARERMKISVPMAHDDNNLSISESDKSLLESVSDHSSNCNQNRGEDIEDLDLILSEEEWMLIRPEDGRTNVASASDTSKLKLKPRVWPNIIAKAFWLQFRMPCAYVFKKATIRLSSSEDFYAIKIRGRCKSNTCKNTFTAHGDKFFNEQGFILHVKTRDTQYDDHEIVKRPLNGKRRKQVKNDLKTEGPSQWRKRYARENMRLGETEPPDLPSTGVLRQAKKEGIDDQLGIKKEDGRDIVRTIERFSEDAEYNSIIHDVGSCPFFVLYSSRAQLHSYKEYCRLNRKTSSIKVDATGSVVHGLQRKYQKRSAHIFLYCIVINFEKTTICVEQMLSEQQNAPFVEFWLRKWLLRGALRPREAVCDYSRTLLSGLCMAFNNQTIKMYISRRFLVLMNPRLKSSDPITFIRVDVAHLMHAVTRWPCFHRRALVEVKDFFKFCVAMLIDCTILQDFEEIFILTCAVALQKHSDGVITLKGAKTTKHAREKLEILIAHRNIRVKVQDTPEKSAVNIGSTPKLDEECKLDGGVLETSSNVDNPLITWIDRLVMKAAETLHDGTDLNAFYHPMFVDHFVKLCKEFPLWSSVGLGYNVFHATSSHVEGYFNDLKSRVFANSLPLRADKFIKRHVQDIKGASMCFIWTLVASRNVRKEHDEIEANVTMKVDSYDRKIIDPQNVEKIEKCEQKSEVDNDFCNIACNIEISNNETIKDDSDLMSYENWRGKASEASFAAHICLSSEVDRTLELSPITEAMNCDTNDEKTEVEFNDHSYSKPRQLDIRLDTTTVSADETKFTVITSTPKSDEKPKKRTVPEKRPNNTNLTKKSKYFTSFAEIRQRNNNFGSSKKPSLLPNGLICPHVKMDGRTYFLRNTCAFDAVVHLLMIAGIENEQYTQFLKSSQNNVLKFVHELIAGGIKPGTFIERTRILKDLSNVEPYVKTEDRIVSYQIDATMNITHMLNQTLKSAPSIFNTEKCSHCPGISYSHVSVGPNHRIITKYGFQDLEKALEFHPKIYKIRCRNGCPGNVTLSREANIHIFIELDIRSNINCHRGLTCALHEMPPALTLKQEKGHYSYILIGVVGFRPGHYMAYCRRSSDRWELFDDMIKGTAICNVMTKVEPHLAVYIRNN